ncbi:50S ribosomal protein L11 methyltransferase [Sneathiella litorea]|uniref:Ribosomal protein L11 methyltransferase n=1 Tax=Sneathiella litorea TaxID=2606216 RepID=A0A6L8W9R7_9PROT|nr:50S ribosomal protein L11 methyltransferase [Sneathiella litorea]MZR31263.1 methyltransferase [Sneathiella litorea]
MSRPPEPTLWQLALTLPFDQVEGISDIFEEEALTISMEEAVSDGSLWRLNILFPQEPNAQLLDRLPADIPMELAPLEQKDWVSESQKMLPPVDAGRFYIHGSHDSPHPANSRHNLLIDAGAAFGTGLHETTYGCLLALNDLRKSRSFRNPLDLGCGSGVLALAIAKAWNIPVLASDIDVAAVIVTRDNAKKNQLAHLTTAVLSAGLNNRKLSEMAPYDLIVANILAWPLMKMAPDISNALSKNGVLVLSGLLGSQDVMVRSAYLQQGLNLKRRYAIGTWNALVLGR